MDEHISVVGLGKLGICLAASAASKGMTVVGVDVSPRTVGLVNEGKAPVLEPGLDEMLALNRQRIVATRDFGLAVARSDITFVVVPTPSESHGGFSLRYVIQAGEEIGKALRHKTSYHLVVIVSTVLPGSTEFGILPVIESASGKKCGPDFGICYGPEFIALGDVLRGMLRPDFVLIGRSDRRAGEVLESFYRAFCDNVPQVCGDRRRDPRARGTPGNQTDRRRSARARRLIDAVSRIGAFQRSHGAFDQLRPR